MREYNRQILDNAQLFGFKAANLMFLKDLNKDLVPNMYPLSNEKITAYLALNIPEFELKWLEFQAIMNGKTSLSAAAKEKLSELRELIIQCFAEHPLEMDELPDDLFMVRSTSDEDKVGSANQGGNDSFPSDNIGLQSTIASVIASYFGERSMLQRLQSGEDIVVQKPLMACLIQKMVGVVETERETSKFVSGVIFTDNGKIRVQAVPGHGKLIVDSLGNFDNFYVTKDDLIYAEISEKKAKIVPTFNQEARKIDLSIIDNDFQIKTNSSLDSEVVQRLAKIGRDIESEYGMKMNIEFVYDKEAQTINIVQLRSRQVGLEFSALSNKFIIEKSPPAIKGRVITPDIMKASIIENQEQLLICDRIETARRQYAIQTNSGKIIKAIIIKEPAASNSHAAGLFTQLNIPILQGDIVQAKKWLSDFTSKRLIMDPQHNSLYQIDVADINDEIIEQGIFKSTLTKAVTPILREFVQPQENVSASSRARPKIDGVIVKAAAQDPLAAQQLFSELYNLIRYPGQQYQASDLRRDLEIIALPKINYPDNDQLLALTNILGFIAHKLKAIPHSKALFQELLIAGGKLHQELTDMSIEPYNEEHLKDYLDVYNKFYGLVYEQREKGSLSESFVTEMADARKDIKYREYANAIGLTSEAAEIFKHSAKLEQFIVNEEQKAKWIQFCSEYCANPRKQAVLRYICKTLVLFDAHEYWLNTEFTTWKEMPTAQYIFDRFRVAEESLKPVQEAVKSLDVLQHQVDQWAEPEKFERLDVFRQQLDEIQDKLDVGERSEDPLVKHATFKQLNRFVDIFDNLIKAVQTSTLYKNKQEQATNYSILVNDFYRLMQKYLVIDAAAEQQDKRIERIEAIQKSLPINPSTLRISEDFSAINSNMYQESYFGFIKGVSSVNRIGSFADFSSFIHQTLLLSLSKKASENNKTLIEVIPSVIKIIQSELKGGYLKTISIHNHKINCSYNIPLRDHSVIFDVIYNINNKEIELNYTFLGQSDLGRWQILEKYSHYWIHKESKIESFKHFSDWNGLEIAIKIDDLSSIDNIVKIVNRMNQVIAHTFMRLGIEDPQYSKALDFFTRFAANTHPPYSENYFSLVDSILIFKNRQQIIKNLSIADLDSKTIQMLTHSDYAILCYRNGYIQPHDIRAIISEENWNENFDLLTSISALELYQRGIKFSELKDLLCNNKEVFEQLTSLNAIEVYKLGIKPSELKALLERQTIENFQQLISDQAIGFYQNGASLLQLETLLIKDCEAYNAIISQNGLEICDEQIETGVKLIDLEDAYNRLGKKSFSNLMSNTRGVSRLLQEGISFSDLVGLCNTTGYNVLRILFDQNSYKEYIKNPKSSKLGKAIAELSSSEVSINITSEKIKLTEIAIDIVDLIKKASGWVIDNEKLWQKAEEKIIELSSIERVDVVAQVMNKIDNTARRERLLNSLSEDEQQAVYEKVPATIWEEIRDLTHATFGNSSERVNRSFNSNKHR